MKKIFLIISLLCSGCMFRAKQPVVHIKLVNNNQSVQFKGLDGAIMGEISRGGIPDVWERLIPVYQMPADTDLKDYQPVQHGAYQLKNDAIVFTPDTPFTKGHTYFMRYYRYEGGVKSWDLIRGKKKLGSVRYQDLVFVD